jgi:hypothetical protein
VWLEEYGFGHSKVDSEIYVCDKDGKFYILVLYVDDNIVAGLAGNLIADV